MSGAVPPTTTPNKSRRLSFGIGEAAPRDLSPGSYQRLAQNPRSPAPPGGFSTLQNVSRMSTITQEELEKQQEALRRENEELKARQEEEELQRQKETQRRITLRMERERQRREKAESSEPGPSSNKGKKKEDDVGDSQGNPEQNPERNNPTPEPIPTPPRRETVTISREIAPDFSMEVSTSESEEERVEDFDSDELEDLPREEQRRRIAVASRQVNDMIIEGGRKSGKVPEKTVRQGVIEGARATLDKYDRQPSVPPLFGQREPSQPVYDPRVWNPNFGGQPMQPGPGGPGGGGPGGPGGGGQGQGNAPIIGNYAWFQRGAWNARRNQFRRSFHAGAAPPGPDIKLAKPPKFAGNETSDEAEVWIQQIERHFILQPHLYMNDQRGIVWASTYLEQGAAAWFKPYWDTLGTSNHPMTQRWASFVLGFIQQYGDPDAELQAEENLRKLQQYTSVKRYTDEFNKLQTKVKWDEVALISQYKAGLKGEVFLFGGTLGWPMNLEGVKQTAARIDESIMAARGHDKRRNPNKIPPRNP